MKKDLTILILQIILIGLQVYVSMSKKKNEDKDLFLKQVDDAFKIKNKDVKISRLNSLIVTANRM